MPNTMLLARFSTHVQKPLYRNAYAWLLSTGISSILGLLYWILAPRFYSREAVGFNAAVVSIMILIAGISQLNLMSALVRFIPNAGSKTAHLTAYSYLISMLLALVASAVFIVLCAQWTALDFLGSDSKFAILFILATMAWTVFNLQDGVLSGLRAAVWVPVDNIGYGIAKIALMIFLAPLNPRLGIFASWIVPTVLLLPPINLLIFRRLIPRHIQATKDRASPLRWREISRYVGSNYLSSLFALASSRLLPVLVVAVVGATGGAYFYPAWAIADSLRLVTAQMATSLTVEGAIDDLNVTVDGSAFLLLLFGLFVPLVVVLVLAAPFILRLSGQDYVVKAVDVLRLLSIAVIPSLVVTWYVSIARVRHCLVEILFAEGFQAVLVLGLSYLLLRPYGVTGVGIASLVSATVVACTLLPQLRSLLLPLQKQSGLENDIAAETVVGGPASSKRS